MSRRYPRGVVAWVFGIAAMAGIGSCVPPPRPSQPADMDPRMSEVVLALDFGPSGITVRPFDRDTYFDHNVNGFSESTAWIESPDAFLVLRPKDDSDLELAGGKALFGRHTSPSPGVSTSLAALCELDWNHDGRLDRADPAYARLAVWSDQTYFTHTNKGEVMSLAEAGILGIDLQCRDLAVEVDGRQVGIAKRRWWQHGIALRQVRLPIDPALRTNALLVPDLPAEDISQLPDAVAFGDLRDLHQAMASKPALIKLVRQLIAKPRAERSIADLDQLLFVWAGVEAVDPRSRLPCDGQYVLDARKLRVIELVIGRPYRGTHNGRDHDPNPHAGAAPLLEQLYVEFRNHIEAQIAAQADPAQFGFLRGGFNSWRTNFDVDWDAAKQAVDTAVNADDAARLSELAGVMARMGVYSNWFRRHTWKTFAALPEARRLELGLVRPTADED